MSNHRKLDVNLKQAKGDNVPIRYISDFLSQLQSVMFHIGDFLAGEEFRTRGHSVEFVKDRCELAIKEVSVGSFQATLVLLDTQATLEDNLSLGEESLEKFVSLAQKIEEENEVENEVAQIIDHPLHRARIIEDLVRLWPAEQDNYRVNIVFDTAKFSLTPTKKLLLEGLLTVNKERQSTEIRGVLGTLTVTPSKIIKIVGPDGNITCLFTEEKEDAAKKYLGRPVKAKGDAVFDAGGRVQRLENVFHLEPFTSITVPRIFSDKAELRLFEPITVSIDYEDDNWIMEYEDLGIISTAPEYDECLKEFHKDFFFVWKEYGLADDGTLSEGAKKVKEDILSVVKEHPYL